MGWNNIDYASKFLEGFESIFAAAIATTILLYLQDHIHAARFGGLES